ncbi:thiol-disulfide oxidoreductase [Rosistilla carotiformis]|uniref:Thiol-disulfide oxidoreductase n=1 Tax=Rosistilla carotiformis TaxID=2528017 RepID=A0A518JYB3_9BACT|nr:redoxin domain-containing protein [Rosistilla carotiformis]QDV70532.1 thiol-disulfide oxidoreductase [Rosistilla carotiformis]
MNFRDLTHWGFQRNRGASFGRVVVCLLAWGCSGLSAVAAESVQSLQLPSAVENQSLRLLDPEAGKLHVICFLGTECPLARLYGPRLSALDSELRDRGVRVLGVNSNRQDSLQEVREYVDRYAISFPMAKDYDGAAATLLGATRTPEVFVLDATGKIRYQGRIDDQYRPGISRPVATRSELREAIDDLLADRPVAMPRTTAVGCIIGQSRPLADEGSITFCKQVSRVLQQHCVECHRAGEIGPFALTDYDEVVGWADMSLEVIDQGRMPPWHANPEYGDFLGARQMSAGDKQILRDWVDQGMPYGNANDLPEPLPPRGDWGLGTPDLVFAMNDKPYRVPAEGTVEYQYFVVDSGFTEDQWIQAAEVIPGDRSVVHHAIIFVRPPDGQRQRGVNWLTAYVPGQRVAEYPPGLARRVPAGSKFVFQMHYTPNGSEVDDLTKVGIKLADPATVTNEVFTVAAIDQEFEIPPRAANHPVQIKPGGLPKAGQLLAVAPHMHLRGKAFRLMGQIAGQQETLLDVPAYDFNWQHSYAFANPIDLSTVKELTGTVWFDNSKDNLVNPDPSQYVSWGDQTWEEMALAFFEVCQPLDDKPDRRANKQAKAKQSHEKSVAADEATQRVNDFVRDFFEQMDTDGDGKVAREETPMAFSRYGFRKFDRDGDSILTRREIEQAAKKRFGS